MTFPILSPERSSLIPVIATLLQFNTKELSEVQTALKDPYNNNRQIKEIKRNLHSAAGESNEKLKSPHRDETAGLHLHLTSESQSV
jgi:hypothetical protein